MLTVPWRRLLATHSRSKPPFTALSPGFPPGVPDVSALLTNRPEGSRARASTTSKRPCQQTFPPWPRRAPAALENQPAQKGKAIMATANTITIAGNLTRDPDLRFTPNGRATASFGVAVNNDWTDPSTGERRESTEFFDVVVWGKPAENAAQSLSKGQEVVVSGRLQQRSWETNEGDRRTRIEVVATAVGVGLSFGTTVFTKASRSGETAA
jgi:single-strand DNA-binding protein